jgi:hypothetical protein
MANLSPLQLVKRDHGSKHGLVDKLVDRAERYDDESGDEFRTRLRRVSNKKLLRLHAATERLASDFSSKEALIDAIAALKFPGKGNPDFRASITGFRVTRLLDLHDSLKNKAN